MNSSEFFMSWQCCAFLFLISSAKLGLHKGCWLPVALFPDEEVLDQIWDFSLGADDVIVCSFPKSGLLELHILWLEEASLNAVSFRDNMAPRDRLSYSQWCKCRQSPQCQYGRKISLPWVCLPWIESSVRTERSAFHEVTSSISPSSASNHGRKKQGKYLIP